ncbi:MAG: hypothetical protein DKM50_12950 [Candidatus Margulisiibacteriota bacterium]|nr:MAG: hypothetical protein A2X43_11255 [Candidatus Margulisbacteria bacterium GWD2_39_127]OGI04157.1 MAG: hypothetical protein A2X42_04540 [Candidatus Margulisbacteria bacterium GWF2_38_17]OGI09310.1 MAG: hypothetical protein A2X41_09295 [Candidatus Margulisbacteria bacterium GWE2_39_32]PZM77381.1 MAG: hypothetical protein DKM50_12950 [Candidatus Margulisiibacteriota bacterium]HAR63959.1 hypothetical protein [Candidatus Margulisiibacteriota bacterium]
MRITDYNQYFTDASIKIKKDSNDNIIVLSTQKDQQDKNPKKRKFYMLKNKEEDKGDNFDISA